MHRIIFLLVVPILLISCNNDVVNKPKNLIEKEKMVDIMYDLSIIEAIRANNPTLLDSFKDNSSEYINKKYKIDSIQFAQSNLYYASKYDEYESMYNDVKSRIEEQKAAIEALVKVEKKKIKLRAKEKNRRKIDSIRKARRSEKIFKQNKHL